MFFLRAVSSGGELLEKVRRPVNCDGKFPPYVSRPQIITTLVVTLPPMLNVRKRSTP